MDEQLQNALSDLETSLTIGIGESGIEWVREQAAVVVKRFREISPMPPEGETNWRVAKAAGTREEI